MTTEIFPSPPFQFFNERYFRKKVFQDALSRFCSSYWSWTHNLFTSLSCEKELWVVPLGLSNFNHILFILNFFWDTFETEISTESLDENFKTTAIREGTQNSKLLKIRKLVLRLNYLEIRKQNFPEFSKLILKDFCDSLIPNESW